MPCSFLWVAHVRARPTKSVTTMAAFAAGGTVDASRAEVEVGIFAPQDMKGLKSNVMLKLSRRTKT